ncbi:MAG TPA: glycerophosphodiester phosphodiesterase family protein [Candidatus Krumholzibacteria bacterium]|nr:glycerophosphodiester phosphodiesterase family protein [Candidatus Krumholzibacteria bacterium]
MRPVPGWLLNLPIAHRGLHDVSRGIPENSLPAFWAAARAGYPLELDVRLLRDGEVVVLHDRDLDRVTHAHGPVSALTSAELRRVSLAGVVSGGGDPRPEDARVPLLRDVLDLIAGSTPLLIEIKNEGDAGDIEPAVAAVLDGYAGPFAVQSFHPGTVAWWRDHEPAVTRGLLAGDFRHEQIDEAMRRRLQNLDLVGACAPDFIGYDIRLLPCDPVRRERAAGRPVIGWTARSLEDARRAREHCDNVIFEGFDAASLRGAS